MAIQTLTLNVNAQPSAEDRAFLYLSQNENGRDIRFRILGDDLPSGCTATLSGVKPDGNVWSKAGTVTNNFVVVEEDIQMTAVAGRWDAQLDIVNGSKNIVTALIRITVEAAAVEAGAVPSDTQLEGYVEQCKQYAESAKNEAYGSPLTAATAAAMTDQRRVYVYTGSETGYTAGHWYYYNGTSWTDGGVYNAVAVDTDTTLSVSGKAADAKKTGDELSTIKEDLQDISETVNGVIDVNYTEGKNITRTGEIVDDENSSVSELIPVTWTWDSETYNRYYFNKAESDSDFYYNIVFYDSNQTVIGYYGSYGTEFRTINGKDNTAYVRFSFCKGTIGKLTNTANPPTITHWIASEVVTQDGIVHKIGDLDNLTTTEKSSLVGAVNELKGEIPALPITPKDTDFFHVSKNMIDPSLCVSGEYVNQVTGAFVTSSAHNRTDYIVVEPSTEYVVRRKTEALGVNFRYVFYDSNKGYISGALGALPDMLLTSPANAKYIAVSDVNAMATIMIAPYVNGDKSYEAFGNDYIRPEYIKQSMDDVLLNVPDKIYALVGYETNIYFENITEKWDDFMWDVTCTKGMQLERGYRITPTASDVGTYMLTIKASTSEEIYKEVETSLIVTSATAGSGETVSVIVLGDSTTNNGVAITKLNENFSTDVMSVTTLGTRGTAPNNHEGRSGWSWDTYFTKESVTYTDGRGTVYNPFYNPSTQTFDASYYFANSGVAIPDVFIVNMGINDVFGYATDTAYESAVTTILQRAETAVQSILDATTNTKVCVCLTIPPNHSQDAFGKAYACGQTRDRCKRNNTLWVNALIEQFKDREDERIYIIPINACLDTVYNMGMETLPVNARNTAITYESPQSNGGVHPVDSGYWQIADVYTAFLKAQA